MAAVPLFVATTFGIPTNVSAAQTDLTGGTAFTLIATAGASGGRFVGAELQAVTAINTSDMVFLHRASGGTRRFIGKANFPTTNPAGIGTDSFLAIFAPQGGPVELAASDTIECAPMTACGTIAVRPLGGSY